MHQWVYFNGNSQGGKTKKPTEVSFRSGILSKGCEVLHCLKSLNGCCHGTPAGIEGSSRKTASWAPLLLWAVSHQVEINHTPPCMPFALSPPCPTIRFHSSRLTSRFMSLTDEVSYFPNRQLITHTHKKKTINASLKHVPESRKTIFSWLCNNIISSGSQLWLLMLDESGVISPVIVRGHHCPLGKQHSHYLLEQKAVLVTHEIM